MAKVDVYGVVEGIGLTQNGSIGRTDEIESLRIELVEIERSRRSSFRSRVSSFSSVTPMDSEHYNDNKYEDEYELQYAAVQKLPTFKRITTALFDEKDVTGKRVVNVTKLGAKERHMFIEKLIKHNENDNLQLLQKIRERIDKVGIQLPSVEVRYKNLTVEPECEVVHGKLLLPTLWNATKSMFSVGFYVFGNFSEAKLMIFHLAAKMASKSLYNPFGFDLKSEDEFLDELPLLFLFQKPLHLVRLLEGSFRVPLPSVLKLDLASSLSCFNHGLSAVPELLLPELLLLPAEELVSRVSPPPLRFNGNLL
ncbi:hypothetical protein LWI29_015015 [Acer saccharum]|uniref:Pleiotropic ABC efflux transporter N-terminal domain-containing protein n=1 Tax=Acer saccharum TaxID=4024 RepID=A0AA39SCD8_ACESA|nr:hypothetical protein LWI29_015015 [Acer saccharum]